MSPPDLPADAPILNVLQPLRINLLPVPGEKADQVLAHHRQRFLCFRVTQKPLLAQSRFDRDAGSFAEADCILIRLFLSQQTSLGQQLRRLLPRLEAIQSVELRHGRTIDPTIRMQHIEHRQSVTLADLEVHFVVCRRHLQNAGPKFRIDRFIANDRELRARQRAPDMFSDQIAIARVVRRDGNGNVGHDRLRPGGGDFEKASRFLDQFVAHIIENALLFRRDHFLIRERGLRRRIPVDHAPSPIDQPLRVKIDENLTHRAHVLRVKGVAQPRPIARTTKPLQLLDNDAAVFILPLQDPAEKFLPADLLPSFFFRFPNVFFHRGLRRDARVIGPRQPQHFMAQHARAPGQNILDGVVQDVPEREHAGDVRRRNDDGECRLGRTRVRMKIAAFEPVLIPLRFDGGGVVSFWQFGHGEQSSGRERRLQNENPAACVKLLGRRR